MSDPIRTILVPTDFSTFSEAAVQTAASFAGALQAKLILLHVVDVPDYGSFRLKGKAHGINLKDIAESTALEMLKRIKQSTDFKGINLQTKVSNGLAYQTVIDESKKCKADLIVMGTHGHTGFDKLLGSTTRRVIRLSQIPILSVKEPLDIKNIKNIAFASSFNQEYSFSFPFIYQFMEMFHAHLYLLKVITPKDFEPTYYSQKIIKDFAEDFQIDDYTPQIVNADSIEKGLEWFCSENKIDLLFMATHGRKGPTHWISSSHTEKMSQQYSCPVFSIKMMKVGNRQA